MKTKLQKEPTKREVPALDTNNNSRSVYQNLSYRYLLPNHIPRYSYLNQPYRASADDLLHGGTKNKDSYTELKFNCHERKIGESPSIGYKTTLKSPLLVQQIPHDVH